MIDIPLADIIAKIKDQKGLSEAEIRKRIKEKLQQLAGLISEEGAAHIVANELGVMLVKEGGEAKVKDLYSGMRSVTVSGKVARKFEVRTFSREGREGKVASFFLADETGQIRVTLWNDQANAFDGLNEGETVRIKNGYVKENRGAAELHLSGESKLEIGPAGVVIGEIKAQSSGQARAPAVRKTVKELAGDEENVELLATIVQLYDPRYFEVCPTCNKRLLDSKCPEHGAVAPQTNYVLSAFLDDGTGNIRATFWKQQAQRLLEKTDAELLRFRDEPRAFEDLKTELLGEIVRIVGRCKRNETFDRIELTANLVFRHLDPEEELNRLKAESAASASRLDAPREVKERIAKTVEPAPKPKTSQFEEERVEIRDDDNRSSDELTGSAEEDVISLDDLEDLDEK